MYPRAMTRIAVVLTLALLGGAFAQADLAERVEALEARVAELDAMLTVPAPPAMTMEVDGFTFTRFQPRASSVGFEVVGEVMAAQSYERVTLRVTLYAEDGSILETTTFLVENVGATPRTFDAGFFSDYTMSDVATFAIQVEDVR